MILTLSALALARAVRVWSSRSSLSCSQARSWAELFALGGADVCTGVFDLFDGVDHGAVVDADGVGVLVFDDCAVHERAELAQTPAHRRCRSRWLP